MPMTTAPELAFPVSRSEDSNFSRRESRLKFSSEKSQKLRMSSDENI